MSSPARDPHARDTHPGDPHWLHPDEREAILRRNITDDTPLVERQRDIARLLDLAARSRRALDAAEAAEPPVVPETPMPLPLV